MGVGILPRGGGGDLTGPLSCLLLAPSAWKWERGGRGRGLGGKPLAFQWAANVVSGDFSSSIHGERHLGLKGGFKGLRPRQGVHVDVGGCHVDGEWCSVRVLPIPLLVSTWAPFSPRGLSSTHCSLEQRPASGLQSHFLACVEGCDCLLNPSMAWGFFFSSQRLLCECVLHLRPVVCLVPWVLTTDMFAGALLAAGEPCSSHSLPAPPHLPAPPLPTSSLNAHRGHSSWGGGVCVANHLLLVKL